jgi:mannose-6-phosphate isomerase-like protein (cupin superfamily)
MPADLKNAFAALLLCLGLALSALAQSAQTDATKRAPSMPIRPFIVKRKQSLDELQKRLSTDNKTEDLIGGEGLQLRVAIQHDKKKEVVDAELHDASDDVYYVLEGSARLTLGGRLDAAHEISPGEWRSKTINGGETFEITKGDLIIVPRGTPHQRVTIAGKEFTLILVKIFAEPMPKPK